MTTQHTPFNTDRYHGLNETQLQSEIYRLNTANLDLLEALKRADTRLTDMIDAPLSNHNPAITGIRGARAVIRAAIARVEDK